MQAALQPLVDQAIAKTINVPEDISPEALSAIYLEAHRLGLKGVTTFRPSPDRPGILTSCPTR
jgi:ribonucleoside-diphosphate reductase alpha chain